MTALTEAEKALIERALRGAGLSDKPAEFDSSIHSWRCEYPDRYGPCDCLAEVVLDVASAVEQIIAERLPVRGGEEDDRREVFK